MTAKAKSRSRILEAVHETAEDLQRMGFIEKRRQRKGRRPLPGANPELRRRADPRAA